MNRDIIHHALWRKITWEVEPVDDDVWEKLIYLHSPILICVANEMERQIKKDPSEEGPVSGGN